MYSTLPSRTGAPGVQALVTELYTQQRARLLAIARRNTANNAGAEEAVQDALMFFIDHFDLAPRRRLFRG